MAAYDNFSSIKRIIGERIPECVIHILAETGFDTKFALKSLKREHIIAIEENFNTNYQELSSKKCTSI